VSAKRFVVRGRVQGVTFRQTAAEYARHLGLAGRVWNREDGAVEAEAAGSDEAIAKFEAWLQHGPGYARVESVEVEDLPGGPQRGGFAVG
jgi:acylphosphatase